MIKSSRFDLTSKKELPRQFELDLAATIAASRFGD
jgi:hypothetical protein